MPLPPGPTDAVDSGVTVEELYRHYLFHDNLLWSITGIFLTINLAALTGLTLAGLVMYPDMFLFSPFIAAFTYVVMMVLNKMWKATSLTVNFYRNSYIAALRRYPREVILKLDLDEKNPFEESRPKWLTIVKRDTIKVKPEYKRKHLHTIINRIWIVHVVLATIAFIMYILFVFPGYKVLVGVVG